MLRVIFKRSLLIASVVLTIALVCLSVRSIWFAEDGLAVSTGGDFGLREDQLISFAQPRAERPSMIWLEMQGDFYSLSHHGGSLHFQRYAADAPPVVILPREITYQSPFVLVSNRPASGAFSKADWWRLKSDSHGFEMTLMGLRTQFALRSPATPARKPMLNRRNWLIVQLPLPLLALIAATPALFWLWRRLRRRRLKGFEVTPVPAAGADAPPGTHQGDEGLVRPPGGCS